MGESGLEGSDSEGSRFMVANEFQGGKVEMCKSREYLRHVQVEQATDWEAEVDRGTILRAIAIS